MRCVGAGGDFCVVWGWEVLVCVYMLVLEKDCVLVCVCVSVREID